MDVWVANDQCWDSITNPLCIRELFGQDFQRDEEWDYPYLTDESNEESLISFLWDVGPEEQLEDE